jgi:hypothetical protein
VTVSIPRAAYDGSATPPNELEIQEWPLSSIAEENVEGPRGYMEPISGTYTVLIHKETSEC